MPARTALHRTRARLAYLMALWATFGAPGGARVKADASLESQGFVGVEARAFWPDASSLTDIGNVAVAARLQVDASVDVLDEMSVRARAFARLDVLDPERRFVFPEEALFKLRKGWFELRAGYQMLNWGDTEAFRPADILNSRVYDGRNLENPEKKGELMGTLRFDLPGGFLEGFVMPMFTEPIFASSRSPLNLVGPGLKLSDPVIFTRRDGFTNRIWQVQWGANLEQSWGPVDFALYTVSHVDRSAPLVRIDAERVELRPMFQEVSQYGGRMTAVANKTIFKLDAAYRRFAYDRENVFPQRDHVIVAAGLEQIFAPGSGADTSLFLEGVYLVPTQAPLPIEAQPLFQHDAMVGVRHAFNDAQSTVLIATCIVDVLEPRRIIAHVNLQRRLGDVWQVSLGARYLSYPPQNPAQPFLYENLHNQHHVYLNLDRFF